MRIDKFLAHTGFGSRKEVKALIKEGRVRVGAEIVKKPETKILPEQDEVYVDNEAVPYVKYLYILLNKPGGVISAANDPSGKETTVTDLVYTAAGLDGLFPVGRLDKDATGLILLTNDGVFAHRVTSPRKNVPKVYAVEVSGVLTERDVTAFREGITLDDGYACRTAELDIIESAAVSCALVTLTEGKYHQVKRMFEALGKQVVTLKRIAFCGIKLPDNLAEGSCRALTANEMEMIAPYLSQE